MARGKRVKNLGWLLRHWKDVDRFIVTRGGLDSGVRSIRGHVDVYLIAKLRDGDEYVTEFASREVLCSWLDRPVFKGVRATWLGHDMVIGSLRWRHLCANIDTLKAEDILPGPKR